MQPRFPLLLLLAWCTCAARAEQFTGKCLEQRVMDMEKATFQLMRQLTLQQLYLEEMTRSGVDSGIKQVRQRKKGPKSYYTPTYAGFSVAAMHNHDNNIRTIGMGELTVVMNGLEFRTRHNDYRLKMPSRSSGDYQAVEDIPFPHVPPEVTSKGSVDEQSAEMKEWFNAWMSGDHSERDYRPYFRPNLCYMEGFWTTSGNGSIEEPFESDRHQIEAETWFELQEKIRFMSYMGDKNMNENFAYLPTTILSTEDGVLVFGQWNYRIVCHPIEGHLNLSAFVPIDNLGNRLARRKTYEQYLMTRAVRFRLESPEGDADYEDHWSFLDDLMYEIPGLNNYGADITDNSFGLQKRHVLNWTAPLNVAKYHRVYRVNKLDAMGQNTNYKGYADRFMFVAENTQPQVAAMSVPYCRTNMQRKNDACDTVTKRVSYAIPLEVIYTTPLQTWNPYNVVYRGEHNSEEGQTVTADGRDGSSPEKALDGIHSKLYMMTPYEFFNGEGTDSDSADTSRGKTYVLDPTNTPRELTTSGIRVQTKNIPGVGLARVRWPIMPISAEGGAAWKEMEALRDVVMDMEAHLLDFPQPPPFPQEIFDKLDPAKNVRLTLRLEPAINATGYQDHSHIVELSVEEFRLLRNEPRQDLLIRTSKCNGHYHELMIYFSKGMYRVRFCDHLPACYDGHLPELTILP